MTDQAEENFVSLRRALKVCAIVMVLVNTARIPFLLLAVADAQRLHDEMAPGAPNPPILGITDFLSTNFLYLSVLAIAFLIATIRITIKSKGGMFIYVNGAVFMVGAVINGIVSETIHQLFAHSYEPICATMMQGNNRIHPSPERRR